MKKDIQIVKKLGANGIVLGALGTDGRIDARLLQSYWTESATGLRRCDDRPEGNIEWSCKGCLPNKHFSRIDRELPLYG